MLARVKAFFEFDKCTMVREFIVLDYIEKPEYDALEPPVIIALVSRGRRKMFYLKEGTTFSDDLSLEMYYKLADLTDDPVPEISCEDMKENLRQNMIQIVYFGPAEDVKEEGRKGYSLNLVHTYDKYQFSEHHTGFF